jgi:hypothetical protein
LFTQLGFDAGLRSKPMNSEGGSNEWTGQRLGSRSVTLFLADGSPHGIVVADVGNWSGKVLAGPRSRLPELLRRAEAARTGVYILLGPDPETEDGQLAYIGEADDIAARMRIHLRSEAKDFFERIVFLVSSDETLTKAHIRYLESRLIKLTQEAGSVALTNDTHPDFQRLPEADRADMETFIEHARLVLPILGCDLFRKRRLASTASTAKATGVAGVDDSIFVFATAGARATARETDDGFVVLVGSTARRRASDTFPAGYLALRDKLIIERQLVDGPSAELLSFATDVIFTSPSAAASIVAARSASGPLEWKTVDTGTTYRDWRAAQLEGPA